MHSNVHNALAFNPNLHGLRGIAALAVLLFHWGSGIGFFSQARREMTISLFDSPWDLGMLLDFGWLGVPLFFVLSGYLLTSQLLHRDLNGKSISRFWLRRGMRIYPAYWLQLLVLILIGNLFAFMPQLTAGEDIVRHVFLWINLPPWMTAPMNAVWWTLPIELSFYLLLPLLVLVSRRIGWPGLLLASLLITICWRYGVMSVYEGANYSRHQAVLDAIPGTLSTFCSGVALACFLAARGAPGKEVRALLLVLGVVLFYAMMYWLRANLDTYWTGHWMLGIWNPMMGLIITMIMLALILPLKGFGWLGSGPMVWLGNISFGVYLWHYPLLMLLHRTVLQDWNTPFLNAMALLVTLAGTFVLASVSYYCIEDPIMRRRFS